MRVVSFIQPMGISSLTTTPEPVFSCTYKPARRFFVHLKRAFSSASDIVSA